MVVLFNAWNITGCQVCFVNYVLCGDLKPRTLFSSFIASLSFVCSASLNTKSPVCTSSTPLYGSLVTSLVRRKMFSRLVSVRTSLPRSKTSTAARLMTRCVCFSCPCNQMVKVLSRHLKKKIHLLIFLIQCWVAE